VEHALRNALDGVRTSMEVLECWGQRTGHRVFLSCMFGLTRSGIDG
jgi:hypothetical protein